MSKLFNENLGTASDGAELSKLKKKYNYYDPSYVALSTMTTRPEFRKWLESVWRQYEPYADTNFPNEFKRQFTQRAWELHLGVTILNRGHILGSHHNSGPDFKIPSANKNIWVEAIAVKKGDGNDRVPNIEFGKVIDVPEQEMLLRLTAGLVEKHQKYLSYLQTDQIGTRDPFIVAVDRSDLEHPDAQIPLILKCLFAIGHQVLFLKSSRLKPTTEGNTWSARKKIDKKSGNSVGMFMFKDSEYEGISAVIYCTRNILNSPRDIKQMGDNFVIVHNPFARNPIEDNFFKFGKVWKQKGEQLIKLNEPS